MPDKYKKKLPKKTLGDKMDAAVEKESQKSVSELKTMRRMNETIDQTNVNTTRRKYAASEYPEEGKARSDWSNALSTQANNRYINYNATKKAAAREKKAGEDSAAEIMRKGGMAKAPKK